MTTKKNSGTTQMTYTYDELNRMDSSLPVGGTETSYTCNAAGQRIAKQTGTTTTRSLWSGGKIIEDFVTAGSTTTKNVYVQGLVTEGVIKPYMYNGYESYTNFYVNSYNAAGDVAATWLINTGNAPSAYNYDAYGSKTGGGALPSPYSYSGYYSDSETGFFYLNARYYDPATQRFTQEDTYWGDGPNLYMYCSGNPVMFTDPSGHFGGRKMMLFEDRVSGRKVKTPAPAPEPISTPAPTPTSNSLPATHSTTETNNSNSVNPSQNHYDKAIPEYSVDENLLTINQYSRPGKKMIEIKAIVIHYVGNPGSTALANRNYFESLKNNSNGIYASAHYIVGLDGEVLQAVPDNEAAIHTGSIKTNLAKDLFQRDDKANYFSIGIESCHIDNNGNYNNSTYTSLVRLAADLLNKYNLSTEKSLLRHNDISLKPCPRLFVNSNAWIQSDYNPAWSQFKSDVDSARKR